jgi:cytochrome c biogenesis protein CcmG/thiol:disulfide interchange protein DsbE
VTSIRAAWWRPALALAAALSLLLVACSGDSPSVDSDVAAGSSLLPESPTALPEFTPERFQSLLAELEGTPVVVNFWASWCGPCRREAAHLAKVARTFEGKAQFIGVDVEDQRAPAREFIREYGWTYPSVFDPSGAIRDSLGYVGQPTTVIYDGSSEPVFEWTGPVSAEQMSEELLKLVDR